MHKNNFKKIPPCEVCRVREQSIFCSIEKFQLEGISQVKGTAYFKKKQVVYYEGNSPLGLYVVHNGKVKLTKTGPLGKEQIIGFAKEASVFGYRALLGNEVHKTSAIALEDSSICVIPKKIVDKLIEEDKDFVKRLMEMSYKAMGDMADTLVTIGQMPVRERLAKVLLNLIEIFGFKEQSTIIDLEISREEYASLIASTKESCMRTFSDFKKEGLIALNGQEIDIKNLNALQRFANALY